MVALVLHNHIVQYAALAHGLASARINQSLYIHIRERQVYKYILERQVYYYILTCILFIYLQYYYILTCILFIYLHVYLKNVILHVYLIYILTCIFKYIYYVYILTCILFIYSPAAEAPFILIRWVFHAAHRLSPLVIPAVVQCHAAVDVLVLLMRK